MQDVLLKARPTFHWLELVHVHRLKYRLGMQAVSELNGKRHRSVEWPAIFIPSGTAGRHCQRMKESWLSKGRDSEQILKTSSESIPGMFHMSDFTILGHICIWHRYYCVPNLPWNSMVYNKDIYIFLIFHNFMGQKFEHVSPGWVFFFAPHGGT